MEPNKSKEELEQERLLHALCEMGLQLGSADSTGNYTVSREGGWTVARFTPTTIVRMQAHGLLDNYLAVTPKAMKAYWCNRVVRPDPMESILESIPVNKNAHNILDEPPVRREGYSRGRL